MEELDGAKGVEGQVTDKGPEAHGDGKVTTDKGGARGMRKFGGLEDLGRANESTVQGPRTEENTQCTEKTVQEEMKG